MAAVEAVKAVRLFKIGGYQKNDQPANYGTNKNQSSFSQFQTLRREKSMPRMAQRRYYNLNERSSDLTDDDFIDESFESSDERNMRNYQYNTSRSTNNLTSTGKTNNSNIQKISNQINDERNAPDNKLERFRNEPYTRNDTLIKEYNKDITKTKKKSESVDIYERSNDPVKTNEKLQLTPRNKDGKLFKIRGTTKTIIEVTTTEVMEEQPYKMLQLNANPQTPRKRGDATNRQQEDQIIRQEKLKQEQPKEEIVNRKEEKKINDQKQDEFKKQEEKKRQEEALKQAKIEELQRAEEKKKQEDQQLKEEKKKQEEQKRLEEQRKQEEKKKQEEQRRLEEQRKQEEKKKQEEQKRLEEQRRQEEKKKQEEQKRLEEQRRQEEKKKQEEEKRLEEQKKQEYQKKMADQKRLEEKQKQEEIKQLKQQEQLKKKEDNLKEEKKTKEEVKQDNRNDEIKKETTTRKTPRERMLEKEKTKGDLKKSQETQDEDTNEKETKRRKTPRERILEKEKTKSDLIKNQAVGDEERIESEIENRKNEIKGGEQQPKLNRREKTRLDLKSQETQKTKLDFKNQETQTRDAQEKSRSDLKKKESQNNTKENEKDSRLQTIKDVSPRREKSKIERKKTENESHQTEHKEVINKQPQPNHENNPKSKSDKEDPYKRGEMHNTKGNEPHKYEDSKFSKKNETEKQKDHKPRENENMDQLKGDKFNKKDKDKKITNEIKNEQNLNGMKDYQKPKRGAKENNTKTKQSVEEEDEGSVAETDNDVSFVLDNKTGTNSKESSSNSFTKTTPIYNDQANPNAKHNYSNKKSIGENKEKKDPIEKSFIDHNKNQKPTRDQISKDKFDENLNRNEIPIINSKKRQLDDEDDDADEFEPKSKVNNPASFNKLNKDIPQKGNNTNKPSTNKYTGFQANSKRDPIKEALSENSKNSLPIQREKNRENPKPKKSEHIETQTIDPITIKKNTNLRNNLGNGEIKKDDILPLINQSLSLSNESSTKNSKSENVKLPLINSNRSHSSHTSNNKTNKTIIPSRRYYDPGYKRCPCLMHNRMYYKGGKPPPEEEQAHSTHDYWNDHQDYELIFGQKYVGYYPAKNIQHDHHHHHDAPYYEPPRWHSNEHLAKRAPWNPVF